MSTMRVTNLKHENSASNNIVLNSDGSVGGDLATTLASKVDYALPVNAQTGTTYTFVAADAEKLTTASNGSAVTLTIPPASSVAWPDNTVLRVVNYGAGAVTIDGGSGVTVTNTATTVAQYGAAVAIRTGSDAWTVVPFGGGDVPAAEVSSPAATGQYTDGSGDTWDYYTFTSSGTLTVDTAGFADVLIVGAGGGGGQGGVSSGNRGGGGGGAGSYADFTSLYLDASTHTVTIGAGGATNVKGNDSQLGDLIATGGGSGGRYATNVNGGNFCHGGSGGGGLNSVSGGSSVLDRGNDGGSGTGTGAGGGGGAGAAGSSSTSFAGAAGGAGTASSITGSSVTRAGGGGGGGGTPSWTGGAGGAGGGGAGGSYSQTGTAGTANTGGGGGGGGANEGSTVYSGGAGGSGVVIVRVKV